MKKDKEKKKKCVTKGDQRKTTKTISKKKICKGKASKQCMVPWPGKPTANTEPISWGDFRIYTDMKMRAYRVKRCGERTDRARSFKMKKPMEAWKEVLDLLNGKA